MHEQRDEMCADLEEVIRYTSEQFERFWLSPFKRRQYRDENRHAQLMLRYIAQRREYLQRPGTAASAAEPRSG